MSLFSIFPFGSSVKYALVFDVSSSSVGVALITHQHKNVSSPQILSTHRTQIKFKDSNGQSSLTDSLSTALASATEVAHKFLSKHPQALKEFDTHVVVHAPWVSVSTERSQKIFDQPIKVTKKIIQEFISKSFSNIERDNPNILSAHISSVLLNDYLVSKVNGSLAQKLDVTLILGSVHESIKQVLTSTLSTALPSTQIHFNTFMHTSIELANAFGARNKEYLLADVSGEYIDLAIIKDGTVQAKTSLEFGSNYLLRAIAEQTQSDMQTAKSKLTMFNDNACTPTECRNIRTALKQTEKEWTQIFGDACAALSKEVRIPSSIFLSSSTFAYTWFAENMSKLDFAQFTATSKPFNISSLIDANDVTAFYKSPSTKKDIRLLLASLYVDKYAPNAIYDNIFML